MFLTRDQIKQNLSEEFAMGVSEHMIDRLIDLLKKLLPVVKPLNSTKKVVVRTAIIVYSYTKMRTSRSVTPKSSSLRTTKRLRWMTITTPMFSDILQTLSANPTLHELRIRKSREISPRSTSSVTSGFSTQGQMSSLSGQ